MWTSKNSESSLSQAELEDLMTKLSLSGSRGLAAVAEVSQEVAHQWLSGERPIPADVGTMLRGLVAINQKDRHRP